MTDAELRELDAAIHREVMGLECFERDGVWRETSAISRDFNGVPCVFQIPDYSTNMQAAWSVVEKLTDEQYVKVRCEQSHWHGNYCSVTASDPTYHDGTELVKIDAHGIWGETMPLAICAAALKAVRGKK